MVLDEVEACVVLVEGSSHNVSEEVVLEDGTAADFWHCPRTVDWPRS